MRYAIQTSRNEINLVRIPKEKQCRGYVLVGFFDIT